MALMIQVNGRKRRASFDIAPVSKEARLASSSHGPGDITYSPLNSNRKEIRLLSLSADWIRGTSARLRARFTTISLAGDDHQPFHAISYTWGHARLQGHMVLDDQDVYVPKSAEEALRGVISATVQGEPPNSLLVWIDAICINQDDINEKSLQVAMMARIYARATSVLSWLGQDDDGSAETAFHSLQSLQRQCHSFTNGGKDLQSNALLPYLERMELPYWNTSHPPDVDHPAILSLFKRKYFTRLWILQEIVVAREVTLVCGAHCLEWQTFAEAVAWLFHAFAAGMGENETVEVLFAPLNIPFWQEDYRQGGVGLSLLLFSSQFFRSSNPWDKIYALLGMADKSIADGEHSVKLHSNPDYSRDLQELYNEATLVAIQSDEDANLLHLAAQTVSDTSEDSDATRPSWVPDYVLLEGELRSLGPEVSKACNNIPAEISVIADDPRILQAQGILLGEVGFATDLPSSVPEIDAFLARLCQLELEWSDTDLNSLSAALVDGLYYNGSDAEDSGEVLSDFVACMSRANDGNPNQALSKGLEILQEELVQVMEDDYQGSADRYRNRIAEQWKHSCHKLYKLIRLQNDLFGVARCTVEIGDAVCIIFGCEVPLILRKSGLRWTIRSDSYIPGISSGSFVQSLQDGQQLENETTTFDFT